MARAKTVTGFRLAMQSLGIAAIVSIPLVTTAMPKAKKPPPVTRYCQQAISGHPLHKHVLVDNETGDVTWTFHNGSTLTYSGTYPGGGLPLHRMGSADGTLPQEFTHAHEQVLGRFSDKLRTWCHNQGHLPPLSPRGPKP